MQIQILNGIYTSEDSDFRTSYPRNMMPVANKTGISNGYLRPAEGIVSASSEGPGIDRGGINWNGSHYRVMGSKLVEIDSAGAISILGDVGSGGLVSFDYSFDRLAVSSDGRFYYWDGLTLTQVTDTDLGTVLDFIWVDGYFMTTDGQYLIVTELADPFSVLPTKYGSSEADPDPIKAIIKLVNEPYALNRYTIEVFNNIGGTGFPFQRVDGAQIQKGTVGTHACCIFSDAIAFVGGGRNEPVAVWAASSGGAVKISTREIDQILSEYTEAELDVILVEPRLDKGVNLLYIHLPDQTLVYDANTSKELGERVWFSVCSGLNKTIYRARNAVWCYGSWWVGDTNTKYIGTLVDDTSEHWGSIVGWEFSTPIVYNEGRGALFHEIELVSLTGRSQLGADPRIYTTYSVDGETWSMPKYISAGKIGERKKRLVWIGQGSMRNWRIQRFYGTSDAHISCARLEAKVEPLAV